MGIEPTGDANTPPDGFEDRGRHQSAACSQSYASKEIRRGQPADARGRPPGRQGLAAADGKGQVTGVRRRDRRDQWGLRVGWVRLALRGTLLGVALCLLSASFLLQRILAPLAAPTALLGLSLIAVGGCAALVLWVVPLGPLEVEAYCPGCRRPERVLRLPFAVEHVCRHCGRHWVLVRGRMQAQTPVRWE